MIVVPKIYRKHKTIENLGDLLFKMFFLPIMIKYTSKRGVLHSCLLKRELSLHIAIKIKNAPNTVVHVKINLNIEDSYNFFQNE